MKRTTIFIDEELERSLRDIAQKDRASLSATIRKALEEFSDRHQSARALPSFLGIGRSGRKDVAERAEEFLWTAPSHKAKA
jgi:hypothetical protein